MESSTLTLWAGPLLIDCLKDQAKVPTFENTDIWWALNVGFFAWFFRLARKIKDKLTRGPRSTARSPEWNSHYWYADVTQYFFLNPVIATNERIIIWAVLGFEKEGCFFYYFNFTIYRHNNGWSVTIWTNSQSRFNSRVDISFGGNWQNGVWTEVVEQYHDFIHVYSIGPGVDNLPPAQTTFLPNKRQIFSAALEGVSF